MSKTRPLADTRTWKTNELKISVAHKHGQHGMPSIHDPAYIVMAYVVMPYLQDMARPLQLILPNACLHTCECMCTWAHVRVHTFKTLTCNDDERRTANDERRWRSPERHTAKACLVSLKCKYSSPRCSSALK